MRSYTLPPLCETRDGSVCLSEERYCKICAMKSEVARNQ